MRWERWIVWKKTVTRSDIGLLRKLKGRQGRIRETGKETTVLIIVGA